MNRFTPLVAVLFFVGLTVASFAQPSLQVVGSTTVDWGEVTPGQSPLKTKVQIKNTGNSTLKIASVKPACGCTTAPLEKSELEAGETTFIDVSLNVSSFSGNVTKTITITSNDPDQVQKTVYLKAKVVRYVSLAPRFVSFRSLEVGKEAGEVVRVQNTGQKDVKVLSIQGSEGIVISPVEPTTLKPGGTLEFTVSTTPESKGFLKGSVVVTTDHEMEEFRTMEMKVYGNAREPRKSSIFLDANQE